MAQESALSAALGMLAWNLPFCRRGKIRKAPRARRCCWLPTLPGAPRGNGNEGRAVLLAGFTSFPRYIKAAGATTGFRVRHAHLIPATRRRHAGPPPRRATPPTRATPRGTHSQGRDDRRRGQCEVSGGWGVQPIRGSGFQRPMIFLLKTTAPAQKGPKIETVTESPAVARAALSPPPPPTPFESCDPLVGETNPQWGPKCLGQVGGNAATHYTPAGGADWAGWVGREGAPVANNNCRDSAPHRPGRRPVFIALVGPALRSTPAS